MYQEDILSLASFKNASEHVVFSSTHMRRQEQRQLCSYLKRSLSRARPRDTTNLTLLSNAIHQNIRSEVRESFPEGQTWSWLQLRPESRA